MAPDGDSDLSNGVSPGGRAPGQDITAHPEPSRQCRGLSTREVEMYSRQMIVPGMGLDSQIRLRSTSALIIGAGGLGCPAAIYLAGAGIGKIGLCDGDVVEISNLHRQIGHAADRVGMLKVDSLRQTIQALNPNIRVRTHEEHLTVLNSIDIMRQYDIVLDCTDNPNTRYLISDTCVLLQKTLVSAAAVAVSGQSTVYNCPPTPQGVMKLAPNDEPAPPCYRCLWPKPGEAPSCSEAGVLGPIVGIMGSIQALETIKIVSAGLHQAQYLGTEADFSRRVLRPLLRRIREKNSFGTWLQAQDAVQKATEDINEDRQLLGQERLVLFGDVYDDLKEAWQEQQREFEREETGAREDGDDLHGSPVIVPKKVVKKPIGPTLVTLESELRPAAAPVQKGGHTGPDPAYAKQPPHFASFRMRARRPDCWACGTGSEANLTARKLRAGEIDYALFCNMFAVVQQQGSAGEEEAQLDNVSAKVFNEDKLSGKLGAHYLIDVRTPEVFSLGHLSGAINLPLPVLSREVVRKDGDMPAFPWLEEGSRDRPLYVMCRTGLDSKKAVVLLQRLDAKLGIEGRRIANIRGGMLAWTKDVDPEIKFF